MKGLEIEFKDHSASWWSHEEDKLSRAGDAMAKSVLSGAHATVPQKDHILVKTGRIDHNKPLEWVIRFGNGLKYGAYQERGMRADGTHVVRHYTTPGTGKHYLRNSGNAATSKGLKSYL